MNWTEELPEKCPPAEANKPKEFKIYRLAEKPIVDDDGKEFGPEELGIVSGTKIGGIGRVRKNEERTFLCSIGAVPNSKFLLSSDKSPSHDSRVEQSNVEKKRRIFRNSSILSIGDGGSLNIYLRNDGTIEYNILLIPV